MLVEYLVNTVSYYDINGVMSLLHISKSQAKKMMTNLEITQVDYLNRKLYLKEDVIELANLKNLREQINLRISPNN